jgi:hypothetical protein
MLILGEAGLRRQPDVAGSRILRLRSSAVPGPGELVDLPGQLEQLALDAGLELHDRLVALLCGLRGTEFVPPASFFQLQKQRSGAIPRMLLIAHEDVLVFTKPKRAQPKRTAAAKSG